MSELSAALASALGRDVAGEPSGVVHGGSINDCYRWPTAAGPVFVKAAPLERAWILDAEADGLHRLRQACTVRVPALLAHGDAGASAFLALEWLELHVPDSSGDRRLGAALAKLHRVRGVAFGLDRDNAIGATHQSNAAAAGWAEFWRERRLGVQLDLARENGGNSRLLDRGRRLLEQVNDFFRGYAPVPSLLHGDLWAGNRAMLGNGEPVVFDPAVYYGDREADLAMTRLFGGFREGFYDAYSAEWPFDDGAAARRDLYNLYHVLNHFNLFGGGYGARAEAMVDRLLAETGH